VKLGGGHDFYFARGDFNPALDGTDSVDAGTGIDTYDASQAIEVLFINLDKVAHDMFPIAAVGTAPVAAYTAIGLDVGGAFKDTIKNFENAIGGQDDDLIYGSATANILKGGYGFDTLLGFGGSDELYGEVGSDALHGGAGKDFLNGGIGADSFIFAAVAESGVGLAARDLITDFENGIDTIWLSLIDANTKNGAVDDAFAFIGNQAFGGVAGQLRVYTFADGQIVEGDVNGDAKADFSIEVAMTAFTTTLTDTDFIL
jgi:Ca2+-binding RTX toxin-like protein